MPDTYHSNRPNVNRSKHPYSARSVRSTHAARSGRIVSRAAAQRFSRNQGSNISGANKRQQNASYDSQNSQKSYALQGVSSQAGQYSRHNPHYPSRKKRGLSKGKKIAIGVLTAVIVVVLGCGSALALYTSSINDKLTGGKTKDEIQAIQDILSPTKSFNEPFYLMLVGSDARADDSEMGARSDTNIVARVDPTINTVTLVSIPRDTRIDLDGYGTCKFNAAYNYGGIKSTITEANQLLDVQISHYAEINFDQMVSLVDAVGGVDVQVDELINDSDADGSTDDASAEHIIIQEGEQHLNGKQALVFVRSRAYVDGDFTRTANQRKLISALVSKVLALPAVELAGVIQSAADCVSTDLSVSDLIALAQQFKDEGDLTIYSGMVPSTTGYLGDISYVFADEKSLKTMMQVVEAGEDPSDITASADASDYSNAGSSSSKGLGGSSGYSGYNAGSSGTSSGYRY